MATNKSEVRASDILRYVLKHKKPYPLPSGVTIDRDLGDGVNFDEAMFCTVAKVDFARDMAVEPSQVTRWASMGLPIEKDGSLVWWKGEAWLKRERGEYWERHWKDHAKKGLDRIQTFLVKLEDEGLPLNEALAETLREEERR